MFSKFKNIQRLASPKALVRVLPTLLLPMSRIQEFLFSLGSPVDLFGFYQYFQLCRIDTTLEKQEDYINSKSFTDKELSCLTVLPCLTTRTLNLSKNLILSIRQKLQKFFNFCFNVSFIPSQKGRGFLRQGL